MPLQDDLDSLAKETAHNYWLKDGVHPTIYFHNHIAEKWIEMFRKNK